MKFIPSTRLQGRHQRVCRQTTSCSNEPKTLWGERPSEAAAVECCIKDGGSDPPYTSQFKMLNMEKKKKKYSQVLEGPFEGPRLFQCLDLYLLPSTLAEQIHILEKSGANKCGKRWIVFICGETHCYASMRKYWLNGILHNLGPLIRDFFLRFRLTCVFNITGFILT